MLLCIQLTGKIDVLLTETFKMAAQGIKLAMHAEYILDPHGKFHHRNDKKYKDTKKKNSNCKKCTKLSPILSQDNISANKMICI